MKELTSITNLSILKGFSKEELVEHAAELENLLLDLESRLNQQKPITIGRKAEVLALLQKGAITVDAIAKRIGISNRNVSSQLSYLRADGHAIATDSIGRKFLEKQEVKQEVKTILRKTA